MSWAFLLPLLLFVIFVICIAFLFAEGMWSNAVRLVNLVTAGLVATNFWEPVARWAEDMEASFTYFWDFLVLWGLFGATLIVLRLATDTISRVKVRFLRIADRIGSGFFAACCGWIMVCFTTMTLHTAPLARNFLYGAFKPEEKMLFGLAPDRQWLGFVRFVSKGVYARGLSEEELRSGKYGTDPSESERTRGLAVFDRGSKFMSTYDTRRAALEQLAESGSFRAAGGVPKR